MKGWNAFRDSSKYKERREKGTVEVSYISMGER
jgi:hypothetical protein